MDIKFSRVHTGKKASKSWKLLIYQYKKLMGNIMKSLVCSPIKILKKK